MKQFQKESKPLILPYFLFFILFIFFQQIIKTNSNNIDNTQFPKPIIQIYFNKTILNQNKANKIVFNLKIPISMKLASSKHTRPTTSKKPEKYQKEIGKIELPKSNINDHDNNDNIVEMMQGFQVIRQQLILRQKQCQKTGKYVQADAFKNKVKTLQKQFEEHRLNQIRQRHNKQHKQIQNAHLQELTSFNISWNNKISQLQKTTNTLWQQLISKHQQQQKTIDKQQNTDKQSKYKQSAQVLNLKKIQQQLAKQQNYLQAHQVQSKVQKLQKQQLQKWKRQYTTKCKTNLNSLKIKQENQLQAFKQRMDLAFGQKTRQKQLQEKQIILKYHNVIKQLEYQQKQQLMKYQKIMKLKYAQKKTKPNILSDSQLSKSSFS